MRTPMRIVKKSSPDKLIRELTEIETSVLMRYWALPSHNRPLDLQLAAGAIICEASEKRGWISCNCGQGSMMFPSVSDLQDKKIVRLTRMSSYPPHSESCPYSWEEGELGGRGKGDVDVGSNPYCLPERPDFLLYLSSESLASGASVQLGSKHREASTKRSRMQTLMFWLLANAEMNRLPYPKMASYKGIQTVANNIELANGVSLKSVLWFTYEAIQKNWVYQTLTRISRSENWPRNTPPQGFLLLVVKSYDEHRKRVTLDTGETVEISGSLEVYGRGGEAGAPYLALISCRLKDNHLQFVKAYLHGIYSPSVWVPVDSSYERAALSVIQNFLWGAEKAGERYAVAKPLSDIRVGESWCRPDFIVSSARKDVMVIETMGSNEPEYRERKHRTHAIMTGLGKLQIDERAEVAQNVADEVLRKKLWHWHHTLLRERAAAGNDPGK